MDDDPYTRGGEFERTSLDETTPYSAPFTPDALRPLTRRRLMGFVTGIALLAMLGEAGFEGCRYHNLSGGIVAVHRGYKY